jgi:hypothetical protein
MKTHLQRALVCLAFVGLHGLANAEVPAATAEALMRKSGVWAQLGDLAAQVKTGIAQSATSGTMTADDVKRLDELADEAFAAPRLRETFMQEVSQRVTVAQSADALKWYGSPTGQRMTRLEEASSASFDDMQRVMADGNKVLGSASAKRYALLTQVVQTTRSAEGMVAMQINTTLAILQGVANVVPNASTPPAQELRRMLEAKKPQMLAQSVGVVLTMFALTYQTASDKELEQYVKFLSSKSGNALSVAMNEALDKSLSGAAQRLGSGIPKVPGTTRL